MRLNLGAGDAPIEGYDNSFDDHQGKEAYPLDLPDACADEVRASHLLEHFGHRGAHVILKEWMRVLKPGGLLKIAVPDLEVIAHKYVNGEPGQYQGWLSGGQVDARDSHLAQYDWHSLCALMRGCGLVGLHKWDDAVGQDCSALDVSLNIAGYKPIAGFPKTLAVRSRPRYGPLEHTDCVMEALLPLGIPVYTRTGAFWGKCLTLAIDAALADGAEWILTLDYDTLFTHEDVSDLLMFMHQKPEADALVPVQIHRMNDKLLMNPKAGTAGITHGELDQPYYQIRTGHFGCTLFRAEVFRRLPRPWFFPSFKEDGSDQYDDDINFWLGMEKAGLNVYLAPRVVLGHLEEVAFWPDRNLKIRYQKISEWQGQGRPKDAWR